MKRAIIIKPVTYDAGGSFLEGPEKFSHSKSHSKISNLMTSELFYAHILNMNSGSLHTRGFRRTHLFVFKYRLTKNGFAGPKRFRDFRETGPRCCMLFALNSNLQVILFVREESHAMCSQIKTDSRTPLQHLFKIYSLSPIF